MNKCSMTFPASAGTHTEGAGGSRKTYSFSATISFQSKQLPFVQDEGYSTQAYRRIQECLIISFYASFE